MKDAANKDHLKGPIVFFLFMCLFCAQPFEVMGAQEREGLEVVATLFPWADMLRDICGKRCSVHCLLPPGADPHHWAPRPKDVKKVRHAVLFVYTSDHLEPWAKRFGGGEYGSGPRVLEVGELSPVSHDPHLWLDFQLDTVFVDRAVEILSSIDREGKKIYQENGKKLKKRLYTLISSFKNALSHCKTRIIVFAGHNAFKNFERSFGIKVVSIMGTSPDAHIKPRSLGRVIKYIRDHRLKYVFYDPAESDRLASTISKETGVSLLELSPGAVPMTGDGKEGFLALMFKNLDALKKGLSCASR